MTVHFVGCEPNVINFSDAPGTTAGYYDSSYSRCYMDCDGPDGGWFELPTLVGDNSAAGYWLHFRMRAPDSTPSTVGARGDWNSTFLAIRDAEGGNLSMLWYGISSTYGQTKLRLYSYDSGTYTESAVWTHANNETYNVDIHCYTDGADSKLKLYINENLYTTVTRTGDDNNGLKHVTFRGFYETTSTTYKTSVSEIIIADTDTRGWRVKTLPPTGDSATNTAWTGSYTDVDEINPDDSGAYATALNQLETYTMGTIGAGMGIAAVAVGGLMSGNGTNDTQLVLRKGGADYTSSDLGVTTAKLAQHNVWNTDPTDSQPWDAGETLSGVEFGVKSVT